MPQVKYKDVRWDFIQGIMSYILEDDDNNKNGNGLCRFKGNYVFIIYLHYEIKYLIFEILLKKIYLHILILNFLKHSAMNTIRDKIFQMIQSNLAWKRTLITAK